MAAEIFLNGKVQLCCGDSLHFLRDQPDNRYDSIVTDPPYALVSIVKRFGSNTAAAVKVPSNGSGAYARASVGFMGKKWDTGETAFAVEFWEQCLRVLKPGGHVVAFGGTRTYHRLACAIEDGGFEIRDMVSWLYGSGFPKSHDVSKGLDKAASVTGTFGNAKSDAHAGWIERGAMRGNEGHEGYQRPWMQDSEAVERAARRYIPGSEAGQQWEGWGTALKPACEPICLARKPLIGTVAQNVLKHGTGAINIDGCRVGTREKPKITDPKRTSNTYGIIDSPGGKLLPDARWPANLIHDGSDEVIAAFGQNSDSSRSEVTSKPGSISENGAGLPSHTGTYGFDDSGSVARFFASFPFSDKDEEWINHANYADNCLNLQSAAAASALANVAEASMQRLALCGASFQALDMTVSGQQFEQVETLLTATILSIEKRFSRGLPPERHSLSSSLASVVATPKQIGIITITISLLKSNGFAEVATFDCTEMSLGVGELVSASKRFHYTSKADLDDRLGSKHPTVKPVDLMQWLVRLITPKGGLVLDPFAGTGTTAEACYREGMRCMLVERETEYQADIRRRMALVGSGPDERARESIKAKTVGQPVDHGPLFSTTR